MKSLVRIALTAAIFGAVLVAFGMTIEPQQALTSYLFAYSAVLTLVVGALIQLMIGHLTGARWFEPFRGITLDIIGALPVIALLALPILLGVRAIYPWTDLSSLAPSARVVVARKHDWLNVPFFVARAVAYLVTWVGVGELLRAWSRSAASEVDDIERRARRLRKASAVGSIAVGITLTFAAFDWLMSLEPTWYSTIYGVYVFAGGILAALAVIAVLAYGFGSGDKPSAGVKGTTQTSALGKLLLTFTIFWGYIAFSQYLIIWMADVPAEVSWYVTRTRGSWAIAAIAIVIGQFAVPLVTLLSWRFKRNPRVLAGIGAWLLLIHALDSYWLVLPALHRDGMRPSWLDVAALMTVTGFVVAGASWRARREKSRPV